MDWVISREPDDRLADTRISLGSVRSAKGDLTGAYLVFRGKPENVLEILEMALTEARRALPAYEYNDKRGRPQG